MNKLDNYIDQLEKYSADHQKINSRVSNVSVGWHIEHTLKVIISIITTLEKSIAKEYRWKFNFWRHLILGINQIPRGKGKAPKGVIPEGEITIESLNLSIKETRIAIEKINTFNPNNYFKHPYFGNLNLKPTKRFLNIHTNHHLKIIKDIIKAS